MPQCGLPCTRSTDICQQVQAELTESTQSLLAKMELRLDKATGQMEETLARNQLEPRSSVPSAATLMPLGQGSEDSALFAAPQELLKGTYRPQMERPLRTMVSSKVLGQLQEDAFGATDTDAASPPRQVDQRRVSFRVGRSPSKTLKTKTSQVLAEEVFGLVPDAKREVVGSRISGKALVDILTAAYF
eukprot:s5132_g5.t1